MNDDEKLPLELVWDSEDSGNHLSEIVRTAIADGQTSIIPDVAWAHLRACEPCVCAVGESAMLSARIGSCLTEVESKASKAVAVQAAPVRLPWLAIAAALVVAGVAAVPSLANAPLWFNETSRVMTNAIPTLVHGVVTAVHGGGAGASLAVSYASATLLMLIGITVGLRATAQNQQNVSR